MSNDVSQHTWQLQEGSLWCAQHSAQWGLREVVQHLTPPGVRIRPSTAVTEIFAGAPRQSVIPFPAKEPVSAGASAQRIIPLSPAEDVVSPAPEEQVIPPQTMDDVLPGGAHQDIGLG